MSTHVIDKCTEEPIDASVGNGSAFHLAINAGDLRFLLVEQRLGHAAISAALEGQKQAIQIYAKNPAELPS